MSQSHDERVDNAIFTGLIGLTFILLEIAVTNTIPKESLNFQIIEAFIILFVGVGIVRIYGIILNNAYLIAKSEEAMKSIIIPISAFLLPIIIYFQFFGGNTFASLIALFVGFVLVNKVLNFTQKKQRIRRKRKSS